MTTTMLRRVLGTRFTFGTILAIAVVCFWTMSAFHALAAVVLYLALNIILNLAFCYFLVSPELAQPMLDGPGWVLLVIPVWFWSFLNTLPGMMRYGYWACVANLPLDIRRIVVFLTPEWLL